MTQLSRQQSELQVHALLEVPKIALSSTCPMTNSPQVDAGVSRLLAEVRMSVILANRTNTARQHAYSLESAITTLGNELSYHSETLLHGVHSHDQELSRIMVNHHHYRRNPSHFILA